MTGYHIDITTDGNGFTVCTFGLIGGPQSTQFDTAKQAKDFAKREGRKLGLWVHDYTRNPALPDIS